MRMTMPLLLTCVLAGCASLGGAPAPGQAGVTTSAATLAPAIRQALGMIPEVDHTYHGQIALAGRVLPLPPGDWVAMRVVGAMNAATQDVRGYVFLVQRQGQTLRAVLSLSTTAVGRPVRAAAKVAGPCTATDVIVTDVRAAAPGSQDCLAVAFYTQAVERAVETANWPAVDGLNLIVPPVFVLGTVRLVTADGEAFADYATNPDLDGVPVDAEPNRALNGWSRDRLPRDPAKRAYVDRLHAFMDGYRTAFRASLGQTQPVPAPGSRPGGIAGRPVET